MSLKTMSILDLPFTIPDTGLCTGNFVCDDPHHDHLHVPQPLHPKTSSADLNLSEKLRSALPDPFGSDDDYRVNCEEPIPINGLIASCGKCNPCLYTARKNKADTITLESGKYQHNTFFTGTLRDKDLTYEYLKIDHKALKRANFERAAVSKLKRMGYRPDGDPEPYMPQLVQSAEPTLDPRVVSRFEMRLRVNYARHYARMRVEIDRLNGINYPNKRARKAAIARYTKDPVVKLRMFKNGEYGTQGERPHYHMVIFNYPSCTQGKTVRNAKDVPTCCEWCRMLHASWNAGRIESEPVSSGLAKYVAGYLLDKPVRRTPEFLRGRHPEFSSGSPNLGTDIVIRWDNSIGPDGKPVNRPFPDEQQRGTIYDALRLRGDMAIAEDVPSFVHYQGRRLNLSRNQRRKLRVAFGMDPGAPPVVLARMSDKLSRYTRLQGETGLSIADAIREKNAGHYEQRRHRERVYSSARKKSL